MTMPGGLLDRVLGAPISAAHPSGLLTAEDYAAARRQGLIGLGTGLLAASGGGPYANLNQRLAAGIGQGQQGYQQALDRAQATAVANQGFDFNQLKMQGAKADMAREQEIQQGRDRIIAANPMPDATDSGALSSWIDRVLPSFIRLGDTETLSKLSEIRKSIEPKRNPAQTVRNIAGSQLGLDPKKTYSVQVDDNGAIVGKPLEEGIAPGTQAGLSLRTEMTPVQQGRLIGQIKTSFRLDAKDAEAAGVNYGKVVQIANRAAAGKGAPDDLIGLVDVMSKMYNPGAIVRVGTVQITMDKLGSWKQKFENWKSQGLTGAPDPGLVKLVAQAASTMAAEWKDIYDQKLEAHKAWGESIGLPRTTLDKSLPSVWDKLPSPTAAPAAPPARLPGESIGAYLKRTGGAQ